jgi:hypothetical protein
MKKTMKLAVIGTLMAIGIATANAQDTNSTTTTNVVLNLNIALTGFRQADESNAAPVRITNKDVLTALNASSGGFNFGRTAKLVVLSSDGGGPSFFVRERTGTSNTSTDVSGFFSTSQTDEIIAKNGNRYSILTVIFDNGAGTDFNVSGFATRKQGRLSGRGIGVITGITSGLSATVSGTGHVSGDSAVLKGTVNASGPKAEIVENNP